MSHLSNIIQATRENSNFRRVVYTGAKSQLVVMAIPSGGEIGLETHYHVEQTLFILKGTGVALLNGERNELAAGDALIVSPGTAHNVLNTGSSTMRIYTVYAPPNHIDGRVHRTKAEADADTADEEFGENVE